MKFDIRDYKGRCVMHCKTEDEAKVFCKYLDSIGRKWRSGASYLLHVGWDAYKDQICYDFNSGRHSNKTFYKRKEYKILEFSDFEWDEMTKPAFKVGDRVRCIDRFFNPNATGKIGTVIDNDDFSVLVEFDEFVNGHDGSGRGKDGRCWWVPNDTECLETIKTPLKVIPTKIIRRIAKK